MKYFLVSIIFIFLSCSHKDVHPSEQIEMILTSNDSDRLDLKIKNLSIADMRIHMAPPIYIIKIADGREFTLLEYVNGNISYMINEMPEGSTTFFTVDLNKNSALYCHELMSKKFTPISLDGAKILAEKKFVYPDTWKFFKSWSNSIPFPKGYHIGKNGFIINSKNYKLHY